MTVALKADWDDYTVPYPQIPARAVGTDMAEFGGAEWYASDPCNDPNFCISLCEDIYYFSSWGTMYYCTSDGYDPYWHLTYAICQCY
jgi:hypothetical protein